MTRGPNSDIQAVILCGPGHSLDPLIDEESTPKALLPIANKPLLYYPITWLQQSGVTGICIFFDTLISNQRYIYRYNLGCTTESLLSFDTAHQVAYN